jgi:hypothetical protein
MWRDQLNALRTNIGAQAPVKTINTPDGLRYALVVTGAERALARSVAVLVADMIETYNAPVGHEEATDWT